MHTKIRFVEILFYCRVNSPKTCPAQSRIERTVTRCPLSQAGYPGNERLVSAPRSAAHVLDSQNIELLPQLLCRLLQTHVLSLRLLHPPLQILHVFATTSTGGTCGFGYRATKKASKCQRTNEPEPKAHQPNVPLPSLLCFIFFVCFCVDLVPSAVLLDGNENSFRHTPGTGFFRLGLVSGSSFRGSVRGCSCKESPKIERRNRFRLTA